MFKDNFQRILFIAKRIKDLKIQGAVNVAKETVKALQLFGLNSRIKNLKDWMRSLEKAANELLAVRPTEPMAQNAVKYLFSNFITAEINTVSAAKEQLEVTVLDFLQYVTKCNQSIVKHAATLIKNKDKIFTHCHSSTVEEALIGAKNKGKIFEVYNTETRPLFQGRITSQQLINHRIKDTMVVDSAAAFFISADSDKDLMMSKVLIGADVIMPDGSVVNKIGSYGIALSAFYEDIPVYVVATLLKTDGDGVVTIEARDSREVWDKAPKKLRIINYAFDKVPAQFITGIITEFGVIKPKQIFKTVREKYPWILK